MSLANSNVDYEAEYDNRGRHPEHPEIFARWTEASAAYRAAADADLDIPYGPAERNRFDLYRPSSPADGAPLAVFIHGGYWRSLDREMFAFMARAFNEAGFAIALPSYTLCPEARIMDIVEEMRRFLAVLWQLLEQRPVVIGHSAGGHLAGCMVATDWAAIDGVPDDLVTAGYAISGLYDLAPLCETSMKDELRLTPETAEAASPLGWPFPRQGRRLVAAVGAEETSEFLRQSRLLADVWGREGVDAEYAPVAGGNHFTVLDALTAADGPMVPAVKAMAGPPAA
ncbi:MAG: alpha/beta hydrolase [Methyloligellaceae bacterium]